MLVVFGKISTSTTERLIRSASYNQLIYRAYFFEPSKAQNARKEPISVNVIILKLERTSRSVLDQHLGDVLPQFIQISILQIEVTVHKLRTA